MPTLPPCVSQGNELQEVDSGFYWLISPGIDPSTVLTQDQIDCHFSAMEQINASFEAQVALDGKYVHWRSNPVWVDVMSASPVDWYKAESLSDVGIDCDVDAWNAAYEPTPHFRFLGSYAKALKTYYCIGDEPPETPPGIDVPDDGPEDCGDWNVLITRPVQIPLNTPTWVEFEITGTFPPEVTSDFEISAMFDGVVGTVEPDTVSGILEVDQDGRRVMVILTNGEYHHLDIFATQPDCSDTVKFDTEMLRASTESQPACQPVLGDTSIKVCDPGTYKAVVTVCGVDHESNSIVVGEAGTVIPNLPVIILHPKTQTVSVGSDVALTVVAKYATSYQWQIANGSGWIDISGETSPTLELNAIEVSQIGSYRVIAANSAGSVVSNPANLTVEELTSCPVYMVLRCDDDRTCHGVMLQKVGPTDEDADFVLDWFNTTSNCCNPVVVRCSTDDPVTDWELFIRKVGSSPDPVSYVIDWLNDHNVGCTWFT